MPSRSSLLHFFGNLLCRPANTAPPPELTSLPKDTKHILSTLSRLGSSSHHPPDLLLRSSDLVSFALPRTLIEAHSPVFQDLLASVPFPSSNSALPTERDLPILDLPERSTPLTIFLRFIYPHAFFNPAPPSVVDPAREETIVLLRSVLEIAAKYQALVVLELVSSRHFPDLIRAAPLEAWAIASRLGLMEEAKEAVRVLAGKGVVLEGARRTGRASDGGRVRGTWASGTWGRRGWKLCPW